jgi:hypothetical protein
MMIPLKSTSPLKCTKCSNNATLLLWLPRCVKESHSAFLHHKTECCDMSAAGSCELFLKHIYVQVLESDLGDILMEEFNDPDIV